LLDKPKFVNDRSSDNTKIDLDLGGGSIKLIDGLKIKQKGLQIVPNLQDAINYSSNYKALHFLIIIVQNHAW
tara:strand:+ start:1796 stop:2011 length:216 start_codon:yes stop_codon:yes gene_type:complete